MKKVIIWVGGVTITLALLLTLGYNYLKTQTKKASPESTVTFSDGDLKMEVFYNRPSKRGRDIFGGLEPYGEVWRTGANEATTFETNQNISFGGKPLPAGKYTLWTIPNPDAWEIIVNDQQYSWGVKISDGKASREPEADIVNVTVPVEIVNPPVEMFTISFGEPDSLRMILEWDDTRVSVPISM